MYILENKLRKAETLLPAPKQMYNCKQNGKGNYSTQEVLVADCLCQSNHFLVGELMGR